MLKRVIALFLTVLFLTGTALAETPAERLAQLDIIAQNDERIQEYEYYYYYQPFKAAGCLPASAVNALLSVLGTPQSDAPRLVLELLTALRNQSVSPAVELGYLYYALTSPRKSATELPQLVSSVTSFHYSDRADGAVTPAQLLSAFDNDDSAHPLLIRRLTPQSSWHWLAELAAYLCENGHPDARIALYGVSAGTLDTSAPLRCSDYGHYIAFYFQAEEFHQDSTIYLMDSYPRALEGEAYGTETPYDIPYPFISETSSPFYQHYTPTRVSDTVVQFNLRQDKLTQLHALDAVPSARLDLQQQFGEVIFTYGSAYLLVYLP